MHVGREKKRRKLVTRLPRHFVILAYKGWHCKHGVVDEHSLLYRLCGFEEFAGDQIIRDLGIRCCYCCDSCIGIESMGYGLVQFSFIYVILRELIRLLENRDLRFCWCYCYCCRYCRWFVVIALGLLLLLLVCCYCCWFNIFYFLPMYVIFYLCHPASFSSLYASVQLFLFFLFLCVTIYRLPGVYLCVYLSLSNHIRVFFIYQNIPSHHLFYIFMYTCLLLHLCASCLSVWLYIHLSIVFLSSFYLYIQFVCNSISI